MKRTAQLLIFVFVLGLALTTSPVQAHCEIPCGIYGDSMRIDMLREHVTTIEKSMNQIESLSKEKTINYNQLVRWVDNKEAHANEIQQIVTQYFMTQRVKPAAAGDSAAMKKYSSQLQPLHQMLVHAMKAKQTTDKAHVARLRALIDQFAKSYFSKKDLEHLLDHQDS